MKPFVLALITLTACTPLIVLGPTGQKNEAGLSVANPAAVYCLQQNGRSEIRNQTLGATGYCIFSDRSWCEEWQFFRGECKRGERFDL